MLKRDLYSDIWQAILRSAPDGFSGLQEALATVEVIRAELRCDYLNRRMELQREHLKEKPPEVKGKKRRK